MILPLLVGIVLLSGCNQQPQQKCNEFEVPYTVTEEKCDLVDFNYEIEYGKTVWTYENPDHPWITRDITIHNFEDKSGRFEFTINLFRDDKRLKTAADNSRLIDAKSSEIIPAGIATNYDSTIDLKLVMDYVPKKRECQTVEQIKYRTETICE